MLFALTTRAHKPLSLWKPAFVSVMAGLSVCLANPCWSIDDSAASESARFSLHGFGTLGITRSNNENIQFVRDLSQPSGADTQWTAKVDSLLGIQANFRFSPQTEAVLQAVTRYHANDS